MLYRMSGFEITVALVIGTDSIGSCESNYHTTTTAPDEPEHWEHTPNQPNDLYIILTIDDMLSYSTKLM
jgi:hypothetical protein